MSDTRLEQDRPQQEPSNNARPWMWLGAASALLVIVIAFLLAALLLFDVVAAEGILRALPNLQL